jgi:predicted NUDIX family NTP pyrophosphohydrolase
MYRMRDNAPEVFLGHPGGPFWSQRDAGAWTIPKGLCEPGEDPLAAAQREFREETGLDIEGPFQELGTFAQPGGKLLSVWAGECDCDPGAMKSNTFEIEWPPHSGRLQTFPEIDTAAWFSVAESLQKVLKGQRPVIEALVKWVDGHRQPAASLRGMEASRKDRPGSGSR